MESEAALISGSRATTAAITSLPASEMWPLCICVSPAPNGTWRIPEGIRHVLANSKWRFDLGRSSVTQNLTSSRARELLAFPGYLAVHDDVAIALGTLHATPFVDRQVVRDLDRQHFELIEVVDHDVGRRAFAQEATILEASAECGQARHAPVDVLEADPLLLAYEANQALRGIASCGQ